MWITIDRGAGSSFPWLQFFNTFRRNPHDRKLEQTNLSFDKQIGFNLESLEGYGPTTFKPPKVPESSVPEIQLSECVFPTIHPLLKHFELNWKPYLPRAQIYSTYRCSWPKTKAVQIDRMWREKCQMVLKSYSADFLGASDHHQTDSRPIQDESQTNNQPLCKLVVVAKWLR